MNTHPQPDVSIIVPVRNEQDCLAECLRSLGAQEGVSYELIVVDDHSTDGSASIAANFPVQVIPADPLPPGWSGKCHAAWSGAKVAKGKWLLFTDADTRHASDSIATGIREAERFDAGLLSYSPRQEVHSFAERALMPVIFSELAACYPPAEVCDPSSAIAAANGQYLLIRRDVYDAIGGHAAVAGAILEDVELAGRAKQAGYKLRFRLADVVSTRMYRSFGAMWEGWTKNLALLFPHPARLALSRLLEFGVIVACAAIAVQKGISGDTGIALVAALLAIARYAVFLSRIWRAHFDWLSDALAIFGLPLFAILLLNSDISHRRGKVRWKGREYGKSAASAAQESEAHKMARRPV
ncbi:MAG TPA: glycosyltransferase [Terriglobales bacterium]|nr:glycosyltransferase [Terriglobales bacterium]